MKNKISQFQLNLHTKLLGFLIKKGNKAKARKILNITFLTLSKRTNCSTSFLLYKLFYKLNVFVEAKIVRFRRRTNIVPFSIQLKRRSYLIVKWLIKALEENKKNISISEKIVEEILSVFKGTSSNSLRLRSINNSQVLANRSNMHYRW